MAGTIVANTLNTDTGVFSTNNAYNGIAKSYVQFSATGGTVTVNGSYNVSSVTRSATGIYTVTFATSMPNANYATVIGNSSAPGASDCNSQIYTIAGSAVSAPTTSSFVLCTKVAYSGGFYDCAYVTAVVFSS
jgi:hypothetical protein